MKIQFKDEIQRQIFLKYANNKDSVKLGNHVIPNNIFRPCTEFKGYMHRWKMIHVVLKMWIVHRALVCINWLFKKHIIQGIEDIPETRENNHIRIFYDAYVKGLEHGTRRVLYPIIVNKVGKQLKITEQDYYDEISNGHNRSYNSRILLLNLWTTLLLEDTFDRGVHDCACLEFSHAMNKFYNNGEIPDTAKFRLYDTAEGRDITYFMEIMDREIWNEESNE